jgi:starch synthase
VGGLSDTVFDWDHSERQVEERNGFVFIHPDYPGIESAMSRAFELWHYSPVEFMKLARNGMRYDYSWAQPAEHYLRIYDHIRQK